METIELAVETRASTGKSSARVMRRAGKVPAVLYGAAREAIIVAVDDKEFETKIGSLEGTHLIRLTSSAPDLGGRLVLVKEVQRHPVSRCLLHTDLYEVDVTAKIKLRVPLHFVGRAEGVEMAVSCSPFAARSRSSACRRRFPISSRSTSASSASTTPCISPRSPLPGVEIPFDTDEALVTVLPPVVEEVKVAAEGEPGRRSCRCARGRGRAKPETPKAGA
jgi:large subunit ribosomal protein L25